MDSHFTLADTILVLDKSVVEDMESEDEECERVRGKICLHNQKSFTIKILRA